MVKEYADALKADLGDVWHVDETAIKIKGQQYWVWEIICAKTRFMISEHLSKTRTIKDSLKLFKEAKTKAVKNHT